jgi:hypothetical protein
MALMPPNSPFYRLDVDPLVIQELREVLGDDKFKTQVDEKLATHEYMGVKLVERNAYRVQLFKTLRLLIATGNAMLEMPTQGGKAVEGRIKVHRLDKYVIRRSPSGQPIEIVLQEMISKEEVPEGIDMSAGTIKSYHEDTPSTDYNEEAIGLYTYCKWDGKRWNVLQEIMGQTVPGTEGQFSADKFPFLPLTWVLTEGENYGRGHVEEYLGDFMSLDGLSQHILEGAAVMAKIIFMVSGNGITNIEDIKRVVNGGFVAGDKNDVTVLQAEKYADFRVAMEESLRIERRLSAAFMLTDAIRRDAERVTATELRLMAQDLEDSLGGVYSVLSQELQYPLAVRVLQMLPPLPEKVDPTIITGFDALGRGHDLNKLADLLNFLQPLGPQTMSTWLQTDEYIARVCVALGIDKTGLITPREAVAAMMQQQEQTDLIKSVAPQLAGAVADQVGQQPQGEGV